MPEHQFNIADAQARLGEILRIVEEGGTVTLARQGAPFARIAPITQPPRAIGILDGQLGKAPDFDEPMSAEELALWEGGGDDPS